VGSLQIVVTAAFALAVTIALAIAPTVNGARCLNVEIASSQEKFQMLKTFGDTYTKSKPLVDGYCVTVDVKQVNSGDAEAALEDGWSGANPNPRPDVWAPASSVWVSLLQARLSVAGKASPVPADFQPGMNSLFASPVVIGMPKPMADALNYPERAVGWSDIFNLATNKDGWASRNGTWGSFKLAKTIPTVSTSGLNALIATYYAAGKPPTVSTVNTDPAVHDFVKAIEDSVVHYGLTAKEFTEDLREQDRAGNPTNYVSAVVLEEQELVEYDTSAKTLLVPIYPSEGTLVEDHPYVLLNWSTEKAAAANAFYRFVESTKREDIDQNGFRVGGMLHLSPLNGGQLERQLSQDGVNPYRALAWWSPPDGPVISAMVDQWKQLRRPARVLLLANTAAGANQLTPVICNIEKAAARFLPQDEVGVATFPDPLRAYTEVLPVAPLGPSPPANIKGCGSPPLVLAAALLQVNRSPYPGSGLDQALSAAVTNLDATYDPRFINAVLVIDVAPTEPSSSHAALFAQLQAQLTATAHGGLGGVRVFAIGPKDDQTLSRITTVGQGFLYSPDASAHFFDNVISGF
jgi:Ca-activated chloride channel family protein